MWYQKEALHKYKLYFFAFEELPDKKKQHGSANQWDFHQDIYEFSAGALGCAGSVNTHARKYLNVDSGLKEDLHFR